MAWLNDDDMLIKDYEFENFKEAVEFVVKVGEISEKAKHHPNILIHEYNHVRIILKTHDEGTVTDKDILLSMQIDKIVV